MKIVLKRVKVSLKIGSEHFLSAKYNLNKLHNDQNMSQKLNSLNNHIQQNS